jgi:GxxExxY protein
MTEKAREELDALTEKIIRCCYAVANTLGAGFLEKVYENALIHELRKASVAVDQQFPTAVTYDGVVVGEFLADILVERCVLVELKATQRLDDIHLAQCMNYLKATGLRVCLLVNFGRPRIEIKRIVNHF